MMKEGWKKIPCHHCWRRWLLIFFSRQAKEREGCEGKVINFYRTKGGGKSFSFFFIEVKRQKRDENKFSKSKDWIEWKMMKFLWWYRLVSLPAAHFFVLNLWRSWVGGTATRCALALLLPPPPKYIYCCGNFHATLLIGLWHRKGLSLSASSFCFKLMVDFAV